MHDGLSEVVVDLLAPDAQGFSLPVAVLLSDRDEVLRA